MREGNELRTRIGPGRAGELREYTDNKVGTRGQHPNIREDNIY